MSNGLVERVEVLARLQFPVMTANQALTIYSHQLAWHDLSHIGEYRVPWCLYHLQNFA
ncbi:hypothetical protein D3C85_1746850 [compost metagenome]